MTESTSIGSAEFWKKRVARALIIGAFALLATQVLPQLPTDQKLEVRAPEGYGLSSLSIAYLTPEDPVALTATRITFPEAAQQAFHTTRLKNGDYRVVVDAVLSEKQGTEKGQMALHDEELLSLQGERVRIFLKESDLKQAQLAPHRE